MSSKSQLLSLVNSSGFLFQLAVEDTIRSAVREHHWRVQAREHPWADPQRGEGFIDLVLNGGNRRIVIECKRVRDGQWVFLLPEMEPRAPASDRLLWTYRKKDSSPCSDHWEFGIMPRTPTSSFCVVRGTGERDRPMLERVAGILVRSIQALAAEELKLGEGPEYGALTIYLPVIVTNAELAGCRFSPSDIEIQSGQLDNAEVESFDVVRFRKSLNPELGRVRTGKDLEEANRLRDRTVFVVRAQAICKFLKELTFLGNPDDPKAPWNQPMIGHRVV